jgi:hypothetical protein
MAHERCGDMVGIGKGRVIRNYLRAEKLFNEFDAGVRGKKGDLPNVFKHFIKFLVVKGVL